MPFTVRKHQCSTCIFGSKSIITPERFAYLREIWIWQNKVQVCHDSHDNIACRGHYEAARRGEIPHPISETAEMTLGITGKTADVMQVCERLGLVAFED